MLVAQQVVDSLHGIERREGNLYEDCVPVAHGTVPQSRKLKGFQFLAVLRLARNKSCGRVYKVGQVEVVALVVLDGADEVYRVEVGSLDKHLLILLVGLVNLRRLQYLQAHGAILIICKERATARFADVLHHSAYSHGAVELLAQVNNEFGILELLDVVAAAVEVALHETYHLLDVFVGVAARVELTQIGGNYKLFSYVFAVTDQMADAEEITLNIAIEGRGFILVDDIYLGPDSYDSAGIPDFYADTITAGKPSAIRLNNLNIGSTGFGQDSIYLMSADSVSQGIEGTSSRADYSLDAALLVEEHILVLVKYLADMCHSAAADGIYHEFLY